MRKGEGRGIYGYKRDNRMTDDARYHVKRDLLSCACSVQQWAACSAASRPSSPDWSTGDEADTINFCLVTDTVLRCDRSSRSLPYARFHLQRRTPSLITEKVALQLRALQRAVGQQRLGSEGHTGPSRPLSPPDNRVPVVVRKMRGCKKRLWDVGYCNCYRVCPHLLRGDSSGQAWNWEAVITAPSTDP